MRKKYRKKTNMNDSSIIKCPVLNLRLLLSAGLRASMYHLSTSDVDNSAIMHCVSMTSHLLRTSLGHMDSPKQSCLSLSNSSATWTVKAPTIVLGYPYGHPPIGGKIVGSTDDIPLHGMMSCCNLLFKPAPLIEHWGWWEIFLGINPHQNPWKNMNIIIM